MSYMQNRLCKDVADLVSNRITFDLISICVGLLVKTTQHRQGLCDSMGTPTQARTHHYDINFRKGFHI